MKYETNDLSMVHLTALNLRYQPICCTLRYVYSPIKGNVTLQCDDRTVLIRSSEKIKFRIENNYIWVFLSSPQSFGKSRLYKIKVKYDRHLSNARTCISEIGKQSIEKFASGKVVDFRGIDDDDV